MSNLLYEELRYQILGACFDVYKNMGNGYTESVYQECLEIEFDLRKIPYVPQAQLPLSYKNKPLKHKFIPDFMCYDKIIVEIKSLSQLMDEHRSQVLNYLNATKFELGLLINFGHYPKVQHERIILINMRG